ncbi:two-component system response regulator [Desulfoluna limicola]|uniref:Two-component system response regulator n=1 Tax=Desulfoluna limicola TaxID=2810562 RepID=A0ABM7PG81_9BACT|nr:HD domain-containing phosphohydrolase [Desulfoluna limicola]BCS96603.1 two-component system response regulator [Desulfoluna limicola]
MTEQKTVLIVDDMPENIKLISQLLKGSCKTKVATNGEKAIEIASKGPPPDLILLDVQMPGMSGYEVCKTLKSQERTRDIPVIFFTSPCDVKEEQHGFELGAVDFINKPVSPPILSARVHTHLHLKETEVTLKHQRDILDVTLLAMGSLAEARNNETRNHIQRTAHFVKRLAEQLKGPPPFHELLTPDYIQRLYKAAPLHDIGKTAVPESILLKPGKLTAEEFEEIKKHTTYGREAILSATRELTISSPYLEMAGEIAGSHHEHWDGSGYPEGLSGEEIPFPARLMALADVYDALVTYRVYKPAFSHEVATQIITGARGTQFEPEVVDAFLASEEAFRTITLQFAGFQEDRRAL